MNATDPTDPTTPVPGVCLSVTAIIATRNRPELLRKAIDSVIGQDYPGRVECLVVFDQSPIDRSIELTQTDRSVRALTNDRRPGLAGARNSGALAANGDLVAFCDDDDEWLPGKLQRQVDALIEANGKVVVSGVRIVYGGRQIDRIPREQHLSFRAFLRDRIPEAHPSTILVRREELLGAIGLVDEEIPGSYGEDYEWLLRAARRAPVVAVPEALVLVRWNRQSWFSDRWEVIVRALTYLVEKYPEFASERLGLAYMYGRTAFAYAALGDRRAARLWARRALILNRAEPRARLAVLVSTGIVPADRVVAVANRFGRGI